MPNPDNAFGFVAVKDAGKEPRVEYYAHGANTIYEGEPVAVEAAGTVVKATVGDGQVLLGIAAESRTASDGKLIAVYDDPETEFIAQVDEDFQLADVFQNTNFVSNSADTALSRSKDELDSTVGTGATKQFKLLGLASRGENAVGSYAIVRCKINNHVFKAGVSGI